jgi:orotate phosphoribosyltransferase
LKGFLVRKEAKGHGAKKLMEGPDIQKGERVIVVDDVATSASSIIKAIEAAREAGLNVVTAMCVLDRGEGGVENLAKINCPLVSLYKKEDMPV